MRRKKGTTVRSPRQSRGVDTVRFILDAADRILAEEGAAAVTTKRVARVAGVGVGTVYQYFPDRVALLREVERRAWGKELELLIARLPELKDETLEQTIVEVVTFTIDGVVARLESHGATMDDAELQAARFDLVAQAEGVVSAGLLAAAPHRLRPGDVRLAVRIAIETTVMLGWVATQREKDALASRVFHAEVAQMIARYLLKDARI
jgi:AcrR family transcriptional regulator